ncbi:hypothetical protein K501DRAFT_242534 [Backusella circina FSU 941]|nr:hypothetical protein K501DRAFT_242534 [Backusella circina FSU 941]
MEDNTVFEEEDDSVAIDETQKHESVKMEHHIVYSTSYQVPVMYFQAFFQDGTPLDLKDIYQHIIPKYYHQELTGLPQNPISQTEHPELGTPFWYIHPCDTRVLMDSIGFKSSYQHHDYIKTWLSFYGPLVKCKVSTSLFK